MKIIYLILLICFLATGCGIYYIPRYYYYCAQTKKELNVYFTCKKDGFNFSIVYPKHCFSYTDKRFKTTYTTAFCFEACTTDIIIKRLNYKIIYNTDKKTTKEAETLYITRYLHSSNLNFYKNQDTRVGASNIKRLLPIQLFYSKKYSRATIFFDHRILPKIEGELTFDNLHEIRAVNGNTSYEIPSEKWVREIKIYFAVEIQAGDKVKEIEREEKLFFGFDRYYINELW